jgi:hypothetical protein
MKWLWDLIVKKLEKNTMRMGVHKTVKQMGKGDSKKWRP